MYEDQCIWDLSRRTHEHASHTWEHTHEHAEWHGSVILSGWISSCLSTPWYSKRSRDIGHSTIISWSLMNTLSPCECYMEIYMVKVVVQHIFEALLIIIFQLEGAARGGSRCVEVGPGAWRRGQADSKQWTEASTRVSDWAILNLWHPEVPLCCTSLQQQAYCYTRGQELASGDTDGYSVRNRDCLAISVGPYRPISDLFSLIFLFI